MVVINMILSDIESMRIKLYDLINSNSDYDKIIEASQELDRLIYDYYLEKYSSIFINIKRIEH